ncbi:hypothetical protein MRX96_020659 [Rhipicephalus microplus]
MVSNIQEDASGSALPGVSRQRKVISSGDESVKYIAEARKLNSRMEIGNDKDRCGMADGSFKHVCFLLQIAASIAGPYFLSSVSPSSFPLNHSAFDGPPFSKACYPAGGNATVLLTDLAVASPECAWHSTGTSSTRTRNDIKPTLRSILFSGSGSGMADGSFKHVCFLLQIAASIAGPYFLSSVSPSSFPLNHSAFDGPPFSKACYPAGGNATVLLTDLAVASPECAWHSTGTSSTRTRNDIKPTLRSILFTTQDSAEFWRIACCVFHRRGDYLVTPPLLHMCLSVMKLSSFGQTVYGLIRRLDVKMTNEYSIIV